MLDLPPARGYGANRRRCWPPAALSHVLPTALLLLALAIMIGASVEIFVLDAQLERHTETQITLARLEGSINRLSALEHHIEGSTEPDLEWSQNFQAARSDSSALLARLEALQGADQQVVALHTMVAEFLSALDETVRFHIAGEHSTAAQWDTERLDPAYGRVTTSLAALSGQLQARADQVRWLTITGSILTIGLVTGLLSLLFIIYHRTRRAADRIEAQQQTRFRALVQHASDVISIIDATGVIGYTSPAVRLLLDYDPAELAGSNIFALVHSADRAWLQSFIAELLRYPGASQQAEVRVRHRSGSWRYLALTSTNLLAEPSVGGARDQCPGYHRAQAGRGAPGPSGLPRRADRVAQPRPLPRSAGACVDPRGSPAGRGRRPVP